MLLIVYSCNSNKQSNSFKFPPVYTYSLEVDSALPHMSIIYEYNDSLYNSYLGYSNNKLYLRHKKVYEQQWTLDTLGDAHEDLNEYKINSSEIFGDIGFKSLTIVFRKEKNLYTQVVIEDSIRVRKEIRPTIPGYSLARIYAKFEQQTYIVYYNRTRAGKGLICEIELYGVKDTSHLVSKIKLENILLDEDITEIRSINEYLFIYLRHLNAIDDGTANSTCYIFKKRKNGFVLLKKLSASSNGHYVVELKDKIVFQTMLANSKQKNYLLNFGNDAIEEIDWQKFNDYEFKRVYRDSSIHFSYSNNQLAVSPSYGTDTFYYNIKLKSDLDYLFSRVGRNHTVSTIKGESFSTSTATLCENLDESKISYVFLLKKEQFFPVVENFVLDNQQGKFQAKIKMSKPLSNEVGKTKALPKFSLEVTNISLGTREDLPGTLAFYSRDSSEITIPIFNNKNKLRLTDKDSLQIYLVTNYYSDSIVLRNYLGIYTYHKPKFIFINKYAEYILPVSIILGFYFLCFVLFYLNPLLLLRIYNAKVFAFVNEIPKAYGGGIIRGIKEIFFEKWFIQRSTMLDVWCKKNHSAILKAFKLEQTVIEHPFYIPLPITNKSENGSIVSHIDKPAVNEVSSFFKRNRVSLEIIGTGGLGKTTLAIEIARWLNEDQTIHFFGNHYWLPILIEEEITAKGDIFNVIKRKLKSWLPAENISDSFLYALLAKQRMLIIIDALSERSQEMQSYIKNIHGYEGAINAIIITSRRKIDLEITDDQFIYPEYLNNSQVAFLIDGLLTEFAKKQNFNKVDKAELLSKIVKLFELNGKEIPISPILIELAIKNLIESKDFQKNGLHAIKDSDLVSIPSVYLQYVGKVIKKNSAADSNKNFEAAAKFLAYLFLQDDYTPKSYNKARALKSLSEYLGDNNKSILNYLIVSGILKEELFDNVIEMIKFSLDPISEYLAAIYYSEQFQNDSSKWQQIYKNLLKFLDTESTPPIGFIQALLLVHEKLWIPYTLPSPSKIPEYKILSDRIFFG